MAGGFHVTSPESPTYQLALTKSPSLSNLEFFFPLFYINRQLPNQHLFLFFQVDQIVSESPNYQQALSKSPYIST